METKSRQQKERDDYLPSLNAAIDSLNLARETTTAKPTKDAFAAASALLITTRVGFPPVHLGRLFADVCRIRLSTKRST